MEFHNLVHPGRQEFIFYTPSSFMEFVKQGHFLNKDDDCLVFQFQFSDLEKLYLFSALIISYFRGYETQPVFQDDLTEADSALYLANGIPNPIYFTMLCTKSARLFH